MKRNLNRTLTLAKAKADLTRIEADLIPLKGKSTPNAADEVDTAITALYTAYRHIENALRAQKK